MTVDFQTLINKPQAFITQTKPAATQDNNIVPQQINPPKLTEQPTKDELKKSFNNGTALLAGAVAIAMPLVAGKGNIVKGLKTIFKGNDGIVKESQNLGKQVKEMGETIANKTKELLDSNTLIDTLKKEAEVSTKKIGDLTEELKQFPEKFIKKLTSNPEDAGNQSVMAKIVKSIPEKGLDVNNLTTPLKEAFLKVEKGSLDVGNL